MRAHALLLLACLAFCAAIIVAAVTVSGWILLALIPVATGHGAAQAALYYRPGRPPQPGERVVERELY